MARQRRIEFAGAIYHVMARGDRREPIVYSDGDRRAWLDALEEMCERTGTITHAFALLGNHYHLVLETPDANLVDGMRWFQNTYTRRFNVCHGLWGHLFGGRYKSIVVDTEGEYFQRLTDYVHLNPARAQLADLQNGLHRYPWCSLALFMKSPRLRPAWLAGDRVFGCTGLKDSPSGRRALLARLERRVHEEGASQAGLVGPDSMPGQSLQATIRRGWYFGSDDFRDRMLRRLSDENAFDDRAVDNGYNARQMWDHRETMARTIIEKGCMSLGLRVDELRTRRANDPGKAMIAELVTSQTSMTLDWVRAALNMGSRGYCCRVIQTRRRRLQSDRTLRCQRAQLLRECKEQ